MTARTVALTSAGRVLPVRADERLTHWWPHLAPHIPGISATPPAPTCALREVVDLTGMDERAEVRRVVNAHLHRLHLDHDTLSVHAAALAAPKGEGSVLLLGGHGAGKTLVATALALHGWIPLAGDVTLVHHTSVIGGTRAFMARTAPTTRWFPDLPQPHPDRARTDLRRLWPSTKDTIPVMAAVWVRVDGDPSLHRAAVEPLDSHTTHSIWWGAGAHLVDRVAAGEPLRLIEDEQALRRRATLTRIVAARFPLTGMWGDPHTIATTIEHTMLGAGESR